MHPKSVTHIYKDESHSTFHLYAHVYRLSQAVHRVSVGLDVANAQSRHLEKQ